jgi:subtilisin family serine protease
VLTNYPADYDNVLSVAAVDEYKNWAEFRYACFLRFAHSVVVLCRSPQYVYSLSSITLLFSNHNPHVNLAAPGSNIHSTIPRKSREASTLIKPDRSVSISSMAARVRVNSGYTESVNQEDEETVEESDGTLGTLMEYSRYVGSPGVSGVLVDCQYGAADSDCILPRAITTSRNTDTMNISSNGTDADVATDTMNISNNGTDADVATTTPYICMLQRGG